MKDAIGRRAWLGAWLGKSAKRPDEGFSLTAFYEARGVVDSSEIPRIPVRPSEVATTSVGVPSQPWPPPAIEVRADPLAPAARDTDEDR